MHLRSLHLHEHSFICSSVGSECIALEESMFKIPQDGEREQEGYLTPQENGITKL